MSKPVILNYFEINADDKIANCKLCDKKISHSSTHRFTSTNLKQHLQINHSSAYDEFLKLDSSIEKPKKYSKTKHRLKNLPIWYYFDRNREKGHEFADCRLCKKTLSYKTTIANLKNHLKRHHINSYNEFLEQSKSVDVNSESEEHSLQSDDAAEELLKVTDVWSYFDIDSSGKIAQCVPCRASVANEYEELKAHLKDNHPKLLLQILQNKDQNSDADSNDGDTDNENVFTEVVYLDPEPSDSVIKKEKTKSLAKPIKKRARTQSFHSTEETPVKKAKPEEVESDELTTFIKYITCLLKKLPPDAFSNVQIEIINAIQKANAQVINTRSIVYNKEQINTCSGILTVDGITPMSSNMVGPNYTITVAPQKQDDTESS